MLVASVCFISYGMVFHTGDNIEMYSGGMGAFLLFLPLIPISWLIRRDWKLIVWGAVPLVSYGVSTLFTYNLRYYMAIFMMANAVLSIAVCVIFDRMFRRKTGLYAILLACVIALPGVWYILKYYPLKTNLTQVSDDISQCVYSGLLKEIPSGKRVISSESFKGDYDGYLTSTTWHGTAWMLLSQAENISEEEYISCFDYFICNTAQESQTSLLERCQNSEFMELELLGHEDAYNLYAIHKLEIPVVASAQTIVPPQSSTGEKPFYVPLDTKPSQVYRITQLLENLYDEPMQFRYQINWMDGAGNPIDVSASVWVLQPGQEIQEFSDEFQAPDEASRGIFYMGIQQEGKEIPVHGYSIQEVTPRDEDAVSRLEQIVKTRKLLKK